MPTGSMPWSQPPVSSISPNQTFSIRHRFDLTGVPHERDTPDGSKRVTEIEWLATKICGPDAPRIGRQGGLAAHSRYRRRARRRRRHRGRPHAARHAAAGARSRGRLRPRRYRPRPDGPLRPGAAERDRRHPSRLDDHAGRDHHPDRPDAGGGRRHQFSHHHGGDRGRLRGDHPARARHRRTQRSGARHLADLPGDAVRRSGSGGAAVGPRPAADRARARAGDGLCGARRRPAERLGDVALARRRPSGQERGRRRQRGPVRICRRPRHSARHRVHQHPRPAVRRRGVPRRLRHAGDAGGIVQALVRGQADHERHPRASHADADRPR